MALKPTTVDTGGRTPIAFVDNNGYVTPFNGRVVAGLPGRYIFTQAELTFYLKQQREMERFRASQRFGVTSEGSDTSTELGVNNAVEEATHAAYEPSTKNSIVGGSHAHSTPPQPPIPSQYVAKPMDPTVPEVFVNVDPADAESLPKGINAAEVGKAVMGS